MRCTIAWLALALMLGGLLLFGDGPQAHGEDKTRKDHPTLNIVAGGINTRGTGLVKDMNLIGLEGQNFKIEMVAQYPIEGEGDRQIRGLMQYVVDQGDDPPGTKYIRVTGPNDPALRGFLQEISRTPHAIVNIDMDLLGPEEHSWQRQTDQLAEIASMVATERLKQQPESKNSIFTHSAATVALSKLINNGQGALFQHKTAASPMTWDLSSDVTIVQVEGDLPSTPTGAVKNIQWLNSASINREGWLGRGNTVIHISGHGFDVQPSDIYKQILKEGAKDAVKALVGGRAGPLAGEVAGNVAGELMDATEAHTAAARPGVRDGKVTVFVPMSAPTEPGEPPSPQRVESFKFQNVSSGQVLKVLEGSGGPSIQTDDSRRTDWDEFKDKLKQLEPPKGGGIALKAVAELPFDPQEISGAEWDDQTGRVVLKSMSGGQTWRLPPINADIARTAYRCIFGEQSSDPEISIGVDPVGQARNPTAAGFSSAYYVGPITDTQFGLIMLRADEALGDIAYGSTENLARRGLDKIVGYHSLSELYPAKYTEQPLKSVLIGSDERIVIQSLPTQLVSEGRDELVYVRRPELAVRFGRTTPAERAYADIFATDYYAILAHVPELRDLVECSRAIGIMKWLRANDIPFLPYSLETTPPHVADTPGQVRDPEPPRLEDLALTRPLIVYSEDGPTDLYPLTGNPTHITYAAGHVKQIVRGDGLTLDVYTDDQGQPIAFEISSVGAAAFSYDAADYTTFYDKVALQRRDDGLIRFQLRPTSRALPETDPWGIINAAASSFIRVPASAPAQMQDASGAQPERKLTPQVVVLIVVLSLVVLTVFALLMRRGRT